jgi:hypothetical protein
MPRTLITIAFVVPVDEEALLELVRAMEESVALNMLSVLERRNADYGDLAEAGFEFYGISASPIRESV